MTLRENIGQQIAMLRKKHGLTTRQLAELSGINFANISKIENGRYNVSVDVLERICSALGVRVKIEEQENG
jgi:transcriptional regulator with XRE-family HTH domain|nr:MAG TPA_asm: helix-turn-helix domain protein [Caudoviricetes sp.]